MSVGLLYMCQPGAAAVAILLVILVYGGDALDGYVARTRGEATTAGAVFDTAGDRIVENTYWIVFAHLGVISIWIPLLMITRSFSVDAMRTLALTEGRTTFGKTTMMESRLGIWLVASRLHRGLYGVTKLVAHCLLALQWCVQLILTDEVAAGRASDWGVAWPSIVLIAQVSAWFVVVYGLARGTLVLYDARRFLHNGVRHEGMHD